MSTFLFFLHSRTNNQIFEYSLMINLILKELKRQEKEVKQQIDLFRLDSWHFQNKVHLMKLSLESHTPKHKTSTPEKSLAKKSARNHKKDVLQGEKPEG